MSQPLVSIIVPCYNSAVNIKNFLEACTESEYKNFEVIINDDKRTNDDTEQVVASYQDRLTIIYKRENISMAQGRKSGASFAHGDILMHLDSDMKVTPGLVGECVAKLETGEADALVIPEEAYGTTFWAKCKWLEKKCYEGVEQIESLRCLKREAYDKVGGHDERMVFSEDKDLDLRIRQAGYKVGRTTNFLWHNEGDLKLLRTLRKKMGYSNTANLFAETHPEAFRWQTNIFKRYLLYLKRISYFMQHPMLYSGMVFMKTAEFGAGATGLIKHRMSG